MGDRFFESPPWRFMISDLDHMVLTWLDRLAMDRVVTLILNGLSTIEFSVPSDNPQVNIQHTDGHPFVSEGNRLVHAFRLEEVSDDVFIWTYRMGGILGTLTDDAQSDNGRTQCQAYDPWWYLYRRPCGFIDSGFVFQLPGPNGMSFDDTRVDVIAMTVLRNTINEHGPVYIDAGTAWGGTGYWAGTIEALPQIDYNIAQGRSVADVWDDLFGDQGYGDIILTPVWDPLNRPHTMFDLSIYAQAGVNRDSSIFGWGAFPNSLVGVNRLYDGSKRVNVMKGFAGQGGMAGVGAGQNIPPATDAGSIAAYGEYWAQQFFPQYNADVAGLVATAAADQRVVDLAKQGQRTFSISPSAERAPVPFRDYNLGDRVPVRIGTDLRQRQLVDTYCRIYGIPIEISDDDLEAVRQMFITVGQAA